VRTPSLTLARIRLRWHRRALISSLVVAISSAAAGFFGALTVADAPSAPHPAARQRPPTSATTTTVASGVAGRLQAGQRGVSVPLPETAPELRVGDRVDVVASALPDRLPAAPTDLGSAVDAAPAAPAVIGSNIEVVDVRPGATTLAVLREQAPAVAAAVATASVTVVLVASAER
jgi:hypothetical protein